MLLWQEICLHFVLVLHRRSIRANKATGDSDIFLGNHSFPLNSLEVSNN